MITLNTDEWTALGFTFSAGLVFGAVAVEILVAPRLNANQAEITKLTRRLAAFTPMDRDQDGRPGGSLPR